LPCYFSWEVILPNIFPTKSGSVVTPNGTFSLENALFDIQIIKIGRAMFPVIDSMKRASLKLRKCDKNYRKYQKSCKLPHRRRIFMTGQ
jgi:hypothetical protein